MGKLINLIGQKFDNLIVIERSGSDNNNKAMWKCKCICGQETIVRGNDLRQGKVHSCGCLKSNLMSKDLAGQRFGKLVAIERKGKNIAGSNMWICKCDCGGCTIVSTNHLTTGNTQSCGCLISKGEIAITDILNQYNINYIKQYYFEDLLGKKEVPLRFDIAIFKNKQLIGLIEFQGLQHYENIYNLSEKDWEYSIKRDNMKRNYCIEKNIKLEEISCFENIKIRLEDILKKWELLD